MSGSIFVFSQENRRRVRRFRVNFRVHFITASGRSALSPVLVWSQFAQNTVGVQQFFVQTVLDCFFETKLKSLAG